MAPPTAIATEEELEQVSQTLLDLKVPLEARFRALFVLRNIGGSRAISSLAAALLEPTQTSALLKHEVAYALGQMQDREAIPYLSHVLSKTEEDKMVRHEAAEALGAIACPTAIPVLQKYLHDSAPEVAQTCEVSLDRNLHCLYRLYFPKIHTLAFVVCLLCFV